MNPIIRYENINKRYQQQSDDADVIIQDPIHLENTSNHNYSSHLPIDSLLYHNLPIKSNVTTKFIYFVIILIIILMIVLNVITIAIYSYLTRYSCNNNSYSHQDHSDANHYHNNNFISSLELISGNQTSDFKIYYHYTNKSIFCEISTSLLQFMPYLYMIEQLTSGLGVRDISWDAGSIISQDLVQFQYLSTKQIQLKYISTNYYSNTKHFIERNFPNSIIWIFDVVYGTNETIFLNFTDFMSIPIGYMHNNDLPSMISSAYGTNYKYIMSKARSVIDISKCKASNTRMYISHTSTYVYDSTSCSNVLKSPPITLEQTLGVSSYITIQSRRTFLSLDSNNPRRSNFFRPRKYHPLSGFNSISYMNESVSLLSPRQQLYIVKHNIISYQRKSISNTNSNENNMNNHNDGIDLSTKLSPLSSSSVSTTYEPIIYFIDADIPFNIRNALLEGIQWWDEAFQYAGYPVNTFQVHVMNRDDFDPYDFYNPRKHFIEWIDRDLRYYSMGIRIQDPRSGEILKGHVRIESLRMRQDALLAEALLGPFGTNNNNNNNGNMDSNHFSNTQGQSFFERILDHNYMQYENSYLNNRNNTMNTNEYVEEAITTMCSENDVISAILQRVKQLGAHEVGHTLGLAHNFAGSIYINGFGSVMDYPPPIITLDESRTKLILNEYSYANTIGYFDKVAIDYGYRKLNNTSSTSSSSEAEEDYNVLDEIICNAITNGYIFLTDQDSDISQSDWRDTKWDTSTNDPIQALNTSLLIRSIALETLTHISDTLPQWTPVSKLQELFPIIYLWHRYEIEATAKLIGGELYQYSLNNNNKASKYSKILQPISSELQYKAIYMLLNVLSPKSISIPNQLLQYLIPTAFSYEPDIGGSSDMFQSRRGAGTFDDIVAMEILSDKVVSAVFQNTRVERIYTQSQHNSSLPSLMDVMNTFTNYIFSTTNVSLSLYSNYSMIQSNIDIRMNDYDAALRVIQSVLVNSYLKICMVPTSSSATKDPSSYVISLCKYHLFYAVIPSIKKFDTYINSQCNIENQSNVNTNNNNDNSIDSNDNNVILTLCKKKQMEWIAHLNYILSMISNGKPFMNIYQIPLGPPI